MNFILTLTLTKRRLLLMNVFNVSWKRCRWNGAHISEKNLLLNNHISLTDEELKIVVNRYKENFDNIEIVELEEIGCMVDKSLNRVDGIYKVAATSANETIQLSGIWRVNYERDSDLGYWYTCSVDISDVKFQTSCYQS